MLRSRGGAATPYRSRARFWRPALPNGAKDVIALRKRGARVRGAEGQGWTRRCGRLGTIGLASGLAWPGLSLDLKRSPALRDLLVRLALKRADGALGATLRFLGVTPVFVSPAHCGGIHEGTLGYEVPQAGEPKGCVIRPRPRRRRIIATRSTARTSGRAR